MRCLYQKVDYSVKCIPDSDKYEVDLNIIIKITIDVCEGAFS